ncbi:hypothetical protein IAR55_002053 [Kwoniella newhampshirensis]|uniref:Uncharacterized protein n=1 Tax=Kwoniella newhampshirensis TaxID=1651941 RepID=A0AAW0YRE1_9TREE
MRVVPRKSEAPHSSADGQYSAGNSDHRARHSTSSYVAAPASSSVGGFYQTYVAPTSENPSNIRDSFYSTGSHDTPVPPNHLVVKTSIERYSTHVIGTQGALQSVTSATVSQPRSYTVPRPEDVANNVSSAYGSQSSGAIPESNPSADSDRARRKPARDAWYAGPLNDDWKERNSNYLSENNNGAGSSNVQPNTVTGIPYGSGDSSIPLVEGKVTNYARHSNHNNPSSSVPAASGSSSNPQQSTMWTIPHGTSGSSYPDSKGKGIDTQPEINTSVFGTFTNIAGNHQGGSAYIGGQTFHSTNAGTQEDTVVPEFLQAPPHGSTSGPDEHAKSKRGKKPKLVSSGWLGGSGKSGKKRR